MPAPAQINENWVDIVPLAAPLHSVQLWTIMLLIGVLVVLIALGIYFYHRPRQRARRALRQLAHDLHRSQIETKPACFKIRQYLAEGFSQHQLQSVQLSNNDHGEWQNFLNRLSCCCFAAEPPDTTELNDVIAEALAWLNKKTVDA